MRPAAWTEKIHMVATGARTLIAFSLSPEQAGDVSAGRDMIRTLRRFLSAAAVRRLKGLSRFEKFDVVFIILKCKSLMVEAHGIFSQALVS